MKIFFLLFIIIITTPAFSAELTGKVIGVADGNNTMTILDQKKQQHIRLYGIDCPEKGQPFGKAAKRLTSRLAAGKQATVEQYDTDKYGRTVGVVSIDGSTINDEIIAAGLAWQYRKYCKAAFCKEWLLLEEIAQQAGKGLWAGHDPVAPWQWRKGARNKNYIKKTTGRYVAASISYHGNRKTRVYHAPSCRWYNCKHCTRNFRSEEEAEEAGYRGCKKCIY